ncbi:MAG: dCTP deaminase [Acidobacteria bacterium]|nr:dCTP deaminase [Acidobacteriota bacterium]
MTGNKEKANIVTGMLTDTEIRESIDQGSLKIREFEPKNIEPASYDVRAGRVLVAKRGIVNLRNEPVVLRHGDWAEIESLEVLELPVNMAASVGLRSSLSRKGINGSVGPQIDPGYHGRVYISVFNASTLPFEITYAMSFATVIFYRLARDASHAYEGKFQGQTTFPEEDVERMLRMEAYTLSDVIRSVGLLEETVNTLTKTSEKMANDLGWVKNLLFAILIALIIGIGQGLIRSWFGIGS